MRRVLRRAKHISKMWFDGFPYLKRANVVFCSPKSCYIAICMKTKPIIFQPR